MTQEFEEWYKKESGLYPLAIPKKQLFEAYQAGGRGMTDVPNIFPLPPTKCKECLRFYRAINQRVYCIFCGWEKITARAWP